MNSDAMIDRLESNVGIIKALVAEVTPEQARWRPSPEKWSIIEVITHLHDEEMEDFRVRIDLLLHQPEEEWPGINPEGWVTERGYQKRDLEESFKGFCSEREASIAWLRGLGSVDWSTYKEHPRAGRLAAGDLFASWVAHDFQHIRQLARLHYAFVTEKAEPFSVDYAG